MLVALPCRSPTANPGWKLSTFCCLLCLQGGSVRLLSDVGLSTLCSTLLGKPLGERGSWQAGLADADMLTQICPDSRRGHAMLQVQAV